MMTPSQLRQYEFKSAGRNAYKAEDVDSFFAEVLISYERMYRENSELIKRVSLLADRLEQYKNDEVDIKQAVLSAQKAADIIVRDAQAASEDAKLEAEAILAAAKGEAQIIKSDAEKQAIADSDLLMSMARDKAEDILNKAKEKAHGILIAANDTASDTVGAANRTITSESLHYDMLKKEVSEFRSSILAQYKAHIELISKLPELAVEEASKLEPQPFVPETTAVPEVDEIEEVAVEEIDEDNVLEFVNEETEESIVEDVREDVVDSTDICEENYDNTVTAENDIFENEDNNIYEPSHSDATPSDIPISRKFAINTNDLNFDGFDDFENDDVSDSADETEFTEDSVDSSAQDMNEVAESSTADLNEDNSNSSFFDSIESVSMDEEPEKPKRKGFFGKWR